MAKTILDKRVPAESRETVECLHCGGIVPLDDALSLSGRGITFMSGEKGGYINRLEDVSVRTFCDAVCLSRWIQMEASKV